MSSTSAGNSACFVHWYRSNSTNKCIVPKFLTLGNITIKMFSWMMVVVVLVAKLCLTLCDPMDCSPPGSSVHGISQARILEWVVVPFSRWSSWPRGQTWVFCTAGGFSTAEPPGTPLMYVHHEGIFLNLMHPPLLVSHFPPAASTPVSAFTELKKVRTLGWALAWGNVGSGLSFHPDHSSFLHTV